MGCQLRSAVIDRAHAHAQRLAGLKEHLHYLDVLRQLASVDQAPYPADFRFSRKALLERYGGHDDRTYTVRERRN